MKWTLLSLTVCSLIVTTGCSQSQPVSDPAKSTPEGYEFRITCRHDVQEEIYVSVLSRDSVDDFGITGAGLNGRDGGKTTMWTPIVLGEDVAVRWGVKGQDGLQMKHQRVFDTAKLVPLKKQVRALELYFSGGESWTLRAYDDTTASNTKKLLMTLEPKK